MTDPLHAALVERGFAGVVVSIGWNGPEAEGRDPAAVAAALARIACDTIVAINRQRRARLAGLDLEDHDRTRLFAAIADACLQPLIDALSAPEGRVVQAAYRLYLAQAVVIPTAEWWTPHLSAVLRQLTPDIYRGRIGGISAVLHEMQNGFAAKWEFRGGLPLDPQVRPEVYDMLAGVVISTLSSELDFAGRIFR